MKVIIHGVAAASRIAESQIEVQNKSCSRLMLERQLKLGVSRIAWCLPIGPLILAIASCFQGSEFEFEGNWKIDDASKSSKHVFGRSEYIWSRARRS